jgi:glyoxylase-like metal-dependent hydrolase (beta-lactamase superfamily II)
VNERIKTIELDFVNAYLVEADGGFVLIDTGMGLHWARLEAELRALGCLPEKLKVVIITHGDLDNVGNCAILQRKYNAQIAMHAGDSAMVEDGALPKRRSRTLSGMLFSWLARLRMGNMTAVRFKPDILLSDGQGLSKAYGFKAKIVHIPGHTKGSIGILTKEGNLFVGDTLVNKEKPETAMYIENAAELKASIEKLKGFKVKMVYPGHGKPFSMDRIPG